MVDEPNDDDYEFAELDLGGDFNEEEDDGTSPSDSAEASEASAKKPSFDTPPEGRNSIVRKAVIAIIGVILLILGYEFVTTFQKKKVTTMSAPVTAVPAPVVTDVAPIVTTPPPSTTATITTPPSEDLSQVKDDILRLDTQYNQLQTQVNANTAQLASLNTGIENLSAEITSIKETLTLLSSRLEQQSHQLDLIISERAAQKKKRVAVVARPRPKPLNYYIQAVIPGRAWLIASNGTTLTVREGSEVPGYGMIRLIDANQGRILTRSGRVITFSQQDS